MAGKHGESAAVHPRNKRDGCSIRLTRFLAEGAFRLALGDAGRW